MFIIDFLPYIDKKNSIMFNKYLFDKPLHCKQDVTQDHFKSTFGLNWEFSFS